MLKRILVGCSVLAAMAIVTPVSAEMNPDPSESMTLDQLDLITGYLVSDQYIASRLKLRQLDQDPVPELITIAMDGKKKSYVRERALQSMSLFQDKRIKDAFLKLLQEKPDRYFALTVMSYLEAFGEDGVKDVEGFLADANPDVRLAVVKGLGLFGGGRGFELLQSLDKTEQNPQVLSELRSYVQ